MIAPRQPAPPEAVARHYDALDGWYREIWGEHVHHGLFTQGRREAPELAARRLVDRVADLADLGPGDVVADVGCGYAATARQLAAERGARMIGFTLSRAQAQYAAAQRPAIDVRVADWTENRLPAASCDVVIAVESLSHMPDKPRAFAQCTRVLRPGGRLVLCDWLAATRRSGWRDRLLLEAICREGRLPSMHTAPEYVAMLRGAGLEPVRFEDRSRQVSRTWTVCLQRGLRRLAHDPQMRRFLLRPGHPERVFALTMLRILGAYGTRAMVYGILVARRPKDHAAG